MTLRSCILLLLTSVLFGVSAAADAKQYPNRGINKDSVRTQYGKPDTIDGPVGKPPITRWLYPDFTVVFEYDLVLHTYARQPDLEKRPRSSLPPRPSTGDTLSMPPAESN